jgi:signal transduction histidine kinase
MERLASNGLCVCCLLGSPWRRPLSLTEQELPVSALGIIAAQSLLIGLLLLDRKRRLRAPRAVEEQAILDRTLATLTTDAVRHAPDAESSALADALARVAECAGGRAPVLVQYADAPARPATRISWSDPVHHRNGSAPTTSQSTNGDVPLTIPVIANPTEQLDRAVLDSLSHDLRQPLAAIRANAQAGALLLTRSAANVAEAIEIFNDIVADDTRAARIIDHVRTLVRTDEPTAAGREQADLPRFSTVT